MRDESGNTLNLLNIHKLITFGSQLSGKIEFRGFCMHGMGISINIVILNVFFIGIITA